MADAPPAVVRQALDNLVNQFANPYDFLRELVQNSIDAGSPRVEVWTRRQPGLLEIHVDDFGAGMDRATIEHFFTRLFASTKEDDISKIGRFGIGFTSVFAIAPEAVLVRTGRHGESWELLFHADRSYELVRLDEPLSGTRITLFKRMEPPELARALAECERTLSWWCEHCDTPITLTHEPESVATPTPTSGEEADPFLPFARPETEDNGPSFDPLLSQNYPNKVLINTPFKIDSDLYYEFTAPEIVGVVGYSEQPRYAFYNGGLTLLNTRGAEALGSYAPSFSQLEFKVKSRELEHTLTRDNVIHDESWAKVMNALIVAADALFERLLDHTEAELSAGRSLDLCHRRLAIECAVPGASRRLERLRRRRIFRDGQGQPLSLAELRRAERREGVVLLHQGPPELSRALDEEGVPRVQSSPGTLALLARCAELDNPGELALPADQVYSLALPQDEGEATRLLADTRRLVRQAAGARVSLRLCGLYGGGEALAMVGPAEGGLFRANRSTIPPLSLKKTILINALHPYISTFLLLYQEQPTEAAWMFAHALLAIPGVKSERIFRRLGALAGAQ